MSYVTKNGRRFFWNGEQAEAGWELPPRLGYSHTNARGSYRLKPDADGWTMTPVPDGPRHVASLEEAAVILDRIEADAEG